MTKYVDIPIINYPFYDLSISLEGNSYILEFCYNSRMELYTFSLYDADREPIILGEALVPEYPMFLDYAIPALSGYFVLLKKENINSQPYKDYPQNLADYYYFMYVYDTEG